MCNPVPFHMMELDTVGVQEAVLYMLWPSPEAELFQKVQFIIVGDE